MNAEELILLHGEFQRWIMELPLDIWETSPELVIAIKNINSLFSEYGLSMGGNDEF